MCCCQLCGGGGDACLSSTSSCYNWCCPVEGVAKCQAPAPCQRSLTGWLPCCCSCATCMACLAPYRVGATGRLMGHDINAKCCFLWASCWPCCLMCLYTCVCCLLRRLAAARFGVASAAETTNAEKNGGSPACPACPGCCDARKTPNYLVSPN